MNKQTDGEQKVRNGENNSPEYFIKIKENFEIKE